MARGGGLCAELYQQGITDEFMLKVGADVEGEFGAKWRVTETEYRLSWTTESSGFTVMKAVRISRVTGEYHETIGSIDKSGDTGVGTTRKGMCQKYTPEERKF
jgi:hypothetical protein